jgi:hypothetical protein
VSAARWIVKGSDVQHRDPGCRGLDGPCDQAARRAPGLDGGEQLAFAIALGLVRELPVEKVPKGTRPGSYGFSKAGKERLPEDIEYR